MYFFAPDLEFLRVTYFRQESRSRISYFFVYDATRHFLTSSWPDLRFLIFLPLFQILISCTKKSCAKYWVYVYIYTCILNLYHAICNATLFCLHPISKLAMPLSQTSFQTHEYEHDYKHGYEYLLT